LIARYRYDALNRRVEKHITDPGSPVGQDATTRFIYDGWRTIEERAVEGVAGSAVEVVRARYGYGKGVPNGTVESRWYLHHDRSGSVVAVTDEAGVLEERITYSAYGKPEFWWNPTWTGHGYQGYAALSEVGVPHTYTSQVGRFLSRDPLGYVDGMSLYQYGQSAPMALRDPLGLSSGLMRWYRFVAAPSLRNRLGKQFAGQGQGSPIDSCYARGVA
jgi:RHS repeat-associated protein